MADVIQNIELELFESQNEIIRLQQEAIGGMLRVLMQHLSIDEIEQMDFKKKIDQAAALKAEHSL